MRNFICVLLLALLCACATAPNVIRLDPYVRADAGAIGLGKTVSLQVVDLSNPPMLGGKQSRYGLEQPNAQVVARILRNTLTQRGFTVLDGSVGERQLQVKIIKADHLITRGVVTDEIAIDVAIELSAVTSEGTRTRTFNDGRSRSVGGSAKIGEVAGDLNQAVGAVLTRAVNDSELMQFLGK